MSDIKTGIAECLKTCKDQFEEITKCTDECLDLLVDMEYYVTQEKHFDEINKELESKIMKILLAFFNAHSIAPERFNEVNEFYNEAGINLYDCCTELETSNKSTTTSIDDKIIIDKVVNKLADVIGMLIYICSYIPDDNLDLNTYLKPFEVCYICITVL